MQAAWARVMESADALKRVTADLPEQMPRRRLVVPAPESAGRLTNDNHPESDRRSLSRRLQVAWAHAIEGGGTVARSFADELQEWLPPRRLRKWLPRRRFRSGVATPAVPDLAWRDWVLFGCTGASIVVTLVTIAIVVADIVARGTP
jgi:hypothetical protein